MSNLDGCRLDIDTINAVWDSFGYKTGRYDNASQPELDEEALMRILYNARHELNTNINIKYDSLIFTYSGHGRIGSILTSDYKYDDNNGNTINGEIEISFIKSYFSGHNVPKKFLSVPKLLIFDACRGIERIIGIKEKENQKGSPIYHHPSREFITLYANTLGNISNDIVPMVVI